MSKYGGFTGPYFPVFNSNTGKYRSENTPYLDTFHAVLGNQLIWKLMLLHIVWLFTTELDLSVQLNFVLLTLSWRRSLSYRNQYIDLLCKSMDWFLYDNGPCRERVNENSALGQDYHLCCLQKLLIRSRKLRKKGLILYLWQSMYKLQIMNFHEKLTCAFS